jgi:hypothetical protein
MTSSYRLLPRQSNGVIVVIARCKRVCTAFAAKSVERDGLPWTCSENPERKTETAPPEHYIRHAKARHDSEALLQCLINQVFFDSPNVCGQGPDSIPVKEMRAVNATFIEGATNLLVEVNGKPLRNLHRVQSKVFEVALPEDNVFDVPCASLGGLPGGIYSPAVDDGVYVRLGPLEVGDHTLHFHAENPDAGFVLDVTYDLMVVPVVQK